MVTVSVSLALAPPLPPQAARDRTAEAVSNAAPTRTTVRPLVDAGRVKRFMPDWLLRLITRGVCSAGFCGRAGTSVRACRQPWADHRCGVRHNANQWKTIV